MKKIQKIIIVIYGILVAVGCIYVPWRARLPSPNSNIVVSLGYSPIWQSLPVNYNNTPWPISVIDIPKIILELIAITAIFGILFVLTLRPKKVLPES